MTQLNSMQADAAQPPSMFSWSPAFHFPWSGGVKQRIEPNVSWFSELIGPNNGNAAVEQKAFTDVASYGKQLGLITEIVLALVDQHKLTPEPKAVAELRLIKTRIDMLKQVEDTLSNDKIVAQVSKVQQRGDPALQALAAQLLPLLLAPAKTTQGDQAQPPAATPQLPDN